MRTRENKSILNDALSHPSVDQPTCRALERVWSNLANSDRGGNSEVWVGVKWMRIKEGRVLVDSQKEVENII
jgi:hypothetical protein